MAGNTMTPNADVNVSQPLLPCPFCGADVTMGKNREGAKIIYWQVECDECGAIAGCAYTTEEEAAKNWNRRLKCEPEEPSLREIWAAADKKAKDWREAEVEALRTYGELVALAPQMFEFYARFFKPVTPTGTKDDKDSTIGYQSEFNDWMNSLRNAAIEGEKK